MKTCLFCFFLILLGTCVRAQSPTPWTDADAARYARERTDSTRWDREMLADDLTFSFDSLPIAPPLLNLPSPVPDYFGGGSSYPTELSLPGRVVRGTTFAYIHDAYSPAPAEDSLDYYGTAFTVYILTDSAHLEDRVNVLLSRNAPHYVAAGKQLTSVGEVSYVQLSLAGGENVALVSRQFFDLRQGRTLLVAPLEDGSLRFLQLTDSPGNLQTGEEAEAYNVAVIEGFEQRLLASPEVVKFFTQPGIL